MTKQEAIEFALSHIPNILPLETDQIRELCEQTIKQANNDPEKIVTSFMSILGQESMALDFIFEFNEKFLHKNERTSARDSIPKDITTKSSSELPKNFRTQPTTPNVIQDSYTPSTSVSPSHDENRGKGEHKIKLNSLKEIDEVLAMLEVSSVARNEGQYVCNCQANRHSLFDPAPNCLKCGKIICIKEGLHMNNCSFCGTELIPLEEKQRIIQLLGLERKNLEQVKVEENKSREKKKKTYKLTSGGGVNLWKEQDKLFEKVEKDKGKEREKERERKRKEILSDENKEVDSQLIEARERLEKLLHFQDTSAERTKIIDNASDFSINDQNLWGSAYERTLQLKKQQRNLRRLEKLERERNGRHKVVLDLTIGKDGKVLMTEAIKKSKLTLNATSDDEPEEISDDEDVHDLEDIKLLKAEIEQQKTDDTSRLYNSKWDYEKFESQFEKPTYMYDTNTSILNDSTQQLEKRYECPSRAQFGLSDSKSVQDEIVAML